MATYKSEAGAILQPGNQINRLSSYNTEGVYAWPGLEFYELIGYFKVDSTTGVTSGDLIVPSPDRRPDDRVRDDRTSLVVQADAARPAYVYQTSIALGQDIPAGGEPSFPASPVTADLVGTNTEIVTLKPANGANPVPTPASVLNGIKAATSQLTAFASGSIAQGDSGVSTAKVPFIDAVTATIAAGDFVDSMMYEVTADTTFKVFNVTALTATTPDGAGISISSADVDAGKAAYIIGRVNYVRPAAASTFADIQGFIDFASQVGGSDS
jgi:hypothetical protein